MKSALHSTVLKLHGKYTSLFLLSCWLFVTSDYYASDAILCVSKFDRSIITGEMEDICLTYSFTKPSVKQRYYVTHYKWIHWVFLLLALLYNLPTQIHHYLFTAEDLSGALESISYLPLEFRIESTALRRSIWYWSRNYGSHASLHLDKILIHVICFLANMLAFFILHLLLQGHNYVLLMTFWPFTRDYHQFHDALSTVFPPFTQCEVTPKMQLWMGRTERVGCHLPLMEIYEKVFLMVWVWQCILAVITLAYICALCCQLRSGGARLSMLCCGGQEHSLLVQKFSGVDCGELLALSLFKPYLTKVQMRCLLYNLANRHLHVQ